MIFFYSLIDSTFWFKFFLCDFEGARNRDRLRATTARSRPGSSAHTRIRGRQNITAAPSATQIHDVDGPLIREQEIMDCLQTGEGVRYSHRHGRSI